MCLRLTHGLKCQKNDGACEVEATWLRKSSTRRQFNFGASDRGQNGVHG